MTTYNPATAEAMLRQTYPYFVEYVDEYGVHCSDNWSAHTLAQELLRGDVRILRVEHYSTLPTED